MSESDLGFTKGYMVYHVLPYFVATFTLFAFGRLVFSILGLENDTDHDREFETREEYLTRKGIMLSSQHRRAADTESYDEFADSIEMASK